MKTKKELEQSVMMLEDALQTSKTNATEYQADLELAKKQLADVNKPELTPMQFDDLYEAIESGIGNYDFSDSDNFDKEFGIDYDGKVTLESFDINNSQELVEAISEEVTKLFAEAEELDTTEADNHA